MKSEKEIRERIAQLTIEMASCLTDETWDILEASQNELKWVLEE